MLFNSLGEYRSRCQAAAKAAVAAIQAKVAGWVGLGQFLPFDEGMARMGAEDSVADLTKAREDLQVRPRAFRECFAECV